MIVRRIANSLIGIGLLGLFICSNVFAQSVIPIDPSLKPYTRTSGISGKLDSIGSDTLNNLMTLWAEGFRKYYPGVKIQIEGKGSSTAPPALINRTAHVGPMSRKMKGTELDQFEDTFGYPPTVFRIAVDALAVYVNKDNPIPGMTLAELDAVFSKQRRRKHAVQITKWKDIKIKDPLAQSTVSLYGRNAASGTYGFFKKIVLKNGDFKDIVKEQPGSASVVQGISKDIAGIGYSGIGYKTSGVRIVPLALSDGTPLVPANYANIINGSYPLWRHLYVYINKPPYDSVSPLVTQFLTYIYSKEGQQIVAKDGYYPLSANDVSEELKKLN
tara:strand:- start:10069 stop:11055 length:987 start_codon:yes stop_codon:yes gene_type:complete